jgi:hypothetical protein
VREQSSELWRLWPIESVIINSPHHHITHDWHYGSSLPADIPTWPQTEPHTSCSTYVSVLRSSSTFELLKLLLVHPTIHLPRQLRTLIP